jgi:hypothetical protein
VTKIGVGGEHCPRETFANVRQIFHLDPLFVRNGFESGQIGNAEAEELHFNLRAKNAMRHARFHRHTGNFLSYVGYRTNEQQALRGDGPLVPAQNLMSRSLESSRRSRSKA